MDDFAKTIEEHRADWLRLRMNFINIACMTNDRNLETSLKLNRVLMETTDRANTLLESIDELQETVAVPSRRRAPRRVRDNTSDAWLAYFRHLAAVPPSA